MTKSTIACKKARKVAEYIDQGEVELGILDNI